MAGGWKGYDEGEGGEGMIKKGLRKNITAEEGEVRL